MVILSTHLVDDVSELCPRLAIMGAGGRLGSARAQYHLRQVCACLSMLPVPRPEVFIIGAWEQFDADGRLKDAAAAHKFALGQRNGIREMHAPVLVLLKQGRQDCDFDGARLDKNARA